MKVKLKEYDIAELSLLAVKKRMQLYLNEILEKAIAAQEDITRAKNR